MNSNTKKWALTATIGLHVVFLGWFSIQQVNYHPDNKWNYVHMGLADEQVELPKEKPKLDIPKNYQERNLDQRRYSVAKTNQAVNEATNELSKGERERIEKEIDAQVNQMAKDQSTTGFMESNANNGASIGVGVKAKKSKEKTKKAGSKKGKEDLGNPHNQKTTVSFFLPKRTKGPKGLYIPVYKCEYGGKVVVNIMVDQYGRVLNATVNENKTTTRDNCLRQMAIKAAKVTEFNQNLNAAKKQRGTITYHFSGKLG